MFGFRIKRIGIMIIIGSNSKTPEQFRQELMTEIGRFEEKSQTEALRQNTIKESRYHEGKAAAYRQMKEFLDMIKFNA